MAVNTTWVFVEEQDGKPAAISLELLTKARTFGGQLAAVLLGTGSAELFAELGRYGATRVFHLTPDERLPTAAAAAAMAELVGSHAPDLLLFGLTSTDRDVAGRLSARLGKPVISNAIEVAIDGDDVTVTNEIFGGAQLVDTVFRAGAPYLVLARPKSFPAEPGDGDTPELIPVEMPEVGQAGSAVVTGRHVEEREGPQLEEAAVVVSAGRGMGSVDQMAIIEELAGLLGAAVGATRAIVDADWIPYSRQVGQTGKTVKPDVYIACGVSGAMQHLVGMKDSKVIIAINKDEEAPIFGVSDLGIVGDVHKVLPNLIAALKAR
ncbi:MAG: electron transfer flavoprotein subunit alpha/FixB family protein [Acidimicrobiia bacterium]|nr:electron transfer flavoprotein subunit alpha/FixB family protein [Acidimicrobiia bacterium]MDH3398423.1 electron transfer flavoprotein subunit alpha/FixB family protein [Acidimicrobiia bacterium]